MLFLLQLFGDNRRVYRGLPRHQFTERKLHYQTLRPGDKKWIPENSLPKGFTKHLINTLKTLMEIAQKEELESAKKIILEVSLSYAMCLLDLGYYEELETVQAFWRKVADDSAGQSPSIFQEVMDYYRKIGERALESLDEKSIVLHRRRPKDVLDDVFRSVGWLGERMLSKVPLEDSPLMLNYEYSSEYDALLNCLLSFEYIYSERHPASYPLIYFDALYVVLRKLIEIYTKDRHRKLEENILSIGYAFLSFAERAIAAKNASGAALAVLRVWDAYEELKDAGLDNQALSVIKPLVRVGILAFDYQDRLESVDFMPKTIHEWISEKLAGSGEQLEGAVMDAYIHGATETRVRHDSAWAFITNLGKRMGTNFGLMFDPSTGQTYPENDPRRR